MILVRDGPAAGSAAWEMAVAHAQLLHASDNPGTGVLRVYRPSRPAVVFGRRDTRAPGFAAAVAAAQAAGFETAVRAVGGRAVAYTPESVVADLVQHDPALQEQERRFRYYGSRIVAELRRLGVDARLGPVPGEYCPGAHSVDARASSKLIGTAQRVIRGAWLFSALAVVGDREQCAALLGDVYAALDQDLDPNSVGALAAEAPALSADQVVDLMVRALGGTAMHQEALGQSVVLRAAELISSHEVSRVH